MKFNFDILKGHLRTPDKRKMQFENQPTSIII